MGSKPPLSFLDPPTLANIMNSAFVKSLNYLDSMDQTFGTDSWPAVQQKYPKFE